jgi:hypothetical protein
MEIQASNSGFLSFIHGLSDRIAYCSGSVTYVSTNETTERHWQQ